MILNIIITLSECVLVIIFLLISLPTPSLILAPLFIFPQVTFLLWYPLCHFVDPPVSSSSPNFIFFWCPFGFYSTYTHWHRKRETESETERHTERYRDKDILVFGFVTLFFHKWQQNIRKIKQLAQDHTVSTNATMIQM